MYKRILIPVDLGDIKVAKPALEKAVALAKGSNGQLKIVNVLSLIPAAYLDYMPTNFDTQERDRAEQDLAKVAAETGLPKESVSTVVRVGAIYHEVLAEAKEWKADVIVVGSHDPSFATYLIGSNAANIVRHAHCSVLVVR